MKSNSSHHFVPHLLFIVLFCAYIFVGLRIYPDYGVPLDEYNQIQIGKMNVERVVLGSRELETHYDRYYGSAFEGPLYVFSHVIAPKVGIPELSARHLGIFLFFSVSVVFYYLLLNTMFGGRWYGVLGAVFLVITPRFFAEGFYNTKDMAFVAATIIVLYALARLDKRSWISLAFLSLATGFSISVRAQGLLLLAVTSMLLFLSTPGNWARRFRTTLGHIGMSVFWFFLFSPVFWTDSMTNIVGFWNASANPLGVPTYYFGRLYISPDLPWHYHFVWVGITGLISVLVLCIVGICWFGIRYVYRRERSSILSRMILAMLLILIGTFATSVFFHPRSYDGWRHIYYIYPSIIGLCLYALKRLAEQAKKPMSRFLFICVVALMSIDGVQAITFITHNHPYQFVYFNAFAGSYPQAKANFDFDYWGVSYKQLFEYLDSLSLMAPTYIYFEQPLPYVEEFMIPKLTKKGFMLTQHIEQTDLYVTIQRDHKEPAPVGFRKIFAATVRGADLSAVYASPSFSGGLYIGKAK